MGWAHVRPEKPEKYGLSGSPEGGIICLGPPGWPRPAELITVRA
jgi:hypothetical protein